MAVTKAMRLQGFLTSANCSDYIRPSKIEKILLILFASVQYEDCSIGQSLTVYSRDRQKRRRWICRQQVEWKFKYSSI